MKCVQCGSSDVIRDGRLAGHSYIRVELYDNPDAFLLRGTKRCQVHADVCTKCGFIMSSVSQDDLRSLRQKYEYEQSG